MRQFEQFVGVSIYVSQEISIVNALWTFDTNNKKVVVGLESLTEIQVK